MFFFIMFKLLSHLHVGYASGDVCFTRIMVTIKCVMWTFIKELSFYLNLLCHVFKPYPNLKIILFIFYVILLWSLHLAIIKYNGTTLTHIDLYMKFLSYSVNNSINLFVLNVIFPKCYIVIVLQHEDEENWPLENKPSCKQSNKKSSNIPMNSQKSITKDDCACYYNYGYDSFLFLYISIGTWIRYMLL